MTDKKIIQVLRICATHIEKGCGLCPQMKYVRCTERLADEAITMIERLTAENAALEPEAVETVKLALCAKHMVDLETLNNTPISRLVELAEADKDGRVVVLPCKVYETDGVRVYEHAVRGIIYRTAGGPDFDESTIGKSIFLTREEAERAMEGKRNG